MFSKRSSQEEKIKTTVNVNNEPGQNKFAKDVPKDVSTRPPSTASRSQNVNQIMKGSKLTGDINVTCDLEVSGDVDGNITSLQQSNILIKGLCKGNIETKEGSVDIQGELKGGNITAGKDVNISGKFDGGEIKAGGKIFVDGKFSGKLEGDDIEIGPNSNGKGEILYKEFISISRGAKVDVQITQTREALKKVKPSPKEVKSASKTDSKDSTPVQQSLEGT